MYWENKFINDLVKKKNKKLLLAIGKVIIIVRVAGLFGL